MKDITPNQVLDDVMTQETYCVEREGVDHDEKKDEDKKKQSVAFKANSSSKNKGKSKKEESSEDEDASDIDDEAMALLVRKMDKFMKKDYGARKRRDHTKSKEYVRRCYNYKSPDHVVANFPTIVTMMRMRRRRRKKRRRRRRRR